MFTWPRIVALGEFVLTGYAVALLAAWLSVEPDSRQHVVIRDANGNHRHFTAPVDDPRLVTLRRQLQLDPQSASSPQLRIALWRREAAAFYAGQQPAPSEPVGGTRPQTPRAGHGDVVHVSFTDGPGEPSIGSQASPLVHAHPDHRQPGHGSPGYWAARRDRLDEQIAGLRHAAQQRQQALLRSVHLGDRCAGIPSFKALLYAGTLGLIVASLFQWRRWAVPPIVLAPTLSTRVQSKRTVADELPLQIPRSWVRVHQPLEVTIRRILCGGLFGAASLVIAISGWPISIGS